MSYITCTTNADSDRVMTWMTLQLEGVGAEEEGGQEGRLLGPGVGAHQGEQLSDQ